LMKRTEWVRSFFQVLLLIIISFFPAERAVYSEDTLRVEHFPETVRQGDVFLVRTSGPAVFRYIHAEFRGEKFPMGLNASRGVYESLIGVDLSTRPGVYEIKVIAKDEESGSHSNSLRLRVQKADFKIQVLSLPSSMVDLDAPTLERVHEEAARLNRLFQRTREEKLWSGPFVLPVAGELAGAFGLRRVINGRPKSSHTGVDLRAEEGTPVGACNDGIVALVDRLFFSGTSVFLDHGWGLYSMYFHLSEALVRQGYRIGKGAVLGRVGSTGRSTGPHLHWGIRIQGARVDPLALLKLSEYLRQ
jgi:murein DD-endopeptidase MepM/ murein hydrolase activator NlpD